MQIQRVVYIDCNPHIFSASYRSGARGQQHQSLTLCAVISPPYCCTSSETCLGCGVYIEDKVSRASFLVPSHDYIITTITTITITTVKAAETRLSVRFCGASHCCYCVVLLLLSLGGTAAARLGSLAPPSTQPTNTPSARLLYVSTCPLLSAHP